MSDLKLEIGEAQIQNAIAVAIAESFSGEKRDAIVRDIVRAHLSMKANSYDKETLLGKRIGDAIRSIAVEAIQAEVDAIKPAIAKVVHDALGPGFEEEVCQQLRSGLAYRKVEGVNVSIRMHEDD